MEPCFGTASDIDITLRSDIKMPLYQQAFRWFREKHGLWQFIEFDDNHYNPVVQSSLVYYCDTYEEAELACLKKLIELLTPTQPMKTFKEYLHSVDACAAAIEWAGDKTIEQVVADCHRGDWLLWLASKCDIGLQPLTLAKGHCANTVRHLMNDDRSLKAVDTAIAFGEGTATREELDAAYAAASAAAYAAAAYAAAAAADAATYADAYVAAAYAAAAAAAGAAAIENRLQTADICRQYIGDLIIQKVNSILNPTQL
jgi:hypothetical protein